MPCEAGLTPRLRVSVLRLNNRGMEARVGEAALAVWRAAIALMLILVGCTAEPALAQQAPSGAANAPTAVRHGSAKAPTKDKKGKPAQGKPVSGKIAAPNQPQPPKAAEPKPAAKPAATAPIVAPKPDNVPPTASTPPAATDSKQGDVKPGEAKPGPRFATLRADKVFLRSGPSADYPVQWVYIRKGLPVEILANFDIWRKIHDFDGTEGWVNQQMLSGRRNVLVSGAIRELHHEAQPDSPVVARLEPGVVAQLAHCNPQWCELKTGGYRGWLKREEIWGLEPGEVVE